MRVRCRAQGQGPGRRWVAGVLLGREISNIKRKNSKEKTATQWRVAPACIPYGPNPYEYDPMSMTL